MGVLATPASHWSLVPIASCSWVLDRRISGRRFFPLGFVSLCRYVVVLPWFSVTGAWGQVGDRRYHVTPVRGSSFLQAPGEGF